MALNLAKAIENVRLNLTKLNIPENPMQIGFAADVSGSMSQLYSNSRGTSNTSTMQIVLTNLFAVTAVFDDNGTMETWAFDTTSRRLTDCNADNYQSYIDRNVTRLVGGGTYYGPVIRDISEYYHKDDAPAAKPGFLSKLLGGGKTAVVKEAEENLPTMIFFLTDGDSTDVKESLEIIEQYKDSGIYWQMIGIGGGSFRTLQMIADKYDHVGFVQIEDLAASEDTLHGQIFTTEVATWLSNFHG